MSRNLATLGRIGGLLKGKADRSGAPASGLSGNDRRLAVELFQNFEQSGAGWFWATDAQGRLSYISECAAKVHGAAAADLVGQTFHALFKLENNDDGGTERTLPLILSAHKTFAELVVRAAIEGDEIWWSLSGRPMFDASGTFLGYRGNGANVTEVRRASRDASRMAEFDSLTGLANRHRMTKRLEATLTAFRTAKRSCAVMMLDLDRFKHVNDTLGHPAGDELLKQVAQRLERVVNVNGCELGRLGGDEFQIILPDLDDRGKLGDLARTIITMLSQPYQIDGSRCIIGASVGIAIAPYDGLTSDELIRNTDLALYAAKGGGRGIYRFYSRDLHAEAERRRQVEDDLRDALVQGQIKLHYQPLVGIDNNMVVGFEALMRWDHPELGPISPGVFIPIAEETDLIIALGEWALRQACSDIVQCPGNLRVAVNVSPPQFRNANFVTAVTSALANSGLPPERLELELTESIFLEDVGAVDEMFATLKKIGVRLALDDFGTGYSSLGYLKTAPFDKIKIDQSFIRGATLPGNRNSAIITAIVSLAEALGMDTTAEGIEALDELALMRTLKVKQIQGMVYSGAVAFENVLAAMSSEAWIIEPDGPNHQRAERMTMLREIGLIHEDHRYDVTMRNLSETGALLEGLSDVPVGTDFVVDFGEGQLAVSKVRWSTNVQFGLEFEIPLIDDGAEGLCTRHRVSPYMLAAAGMPLAALPPGQYPLVGAAGFSFPRFHQPGSLKAPR